MYIVYNQLNLNHYYKAMASGTNRLILSEAQKNKSTTAARKEYNREARDYANDCAKKIVKGKK